MIRVYESGGKRVCPPVERIKEALSIHDEMKVPNECDHESSANDNDPYFPIKMFFFEVCHG
tara:strand:+ start:718 stop:900 length:183 start_codon:yes stop_codon:yes gene_type:complete